MSDVNNSKPEVVESENASVNPDCQEQTTSSVNEELQAPIARLQAEQLRLITISVLLIAMLALGAIFVYAKSVLIPFVLAMFISILVSPVQT